MNPLDAMRDHGIEEIVAVHDPRTGLLGYLVIDDTSRGPAFGGCRLFPYESAEAALADGVALARAMTRKCALAGLNAGGAKGVLIDHDGIADRREMLRALGRYVESLGGRFYTSGDVGLAPEDIACIRETSRFVAVPDPERLDLSTATADGVIFGIRGALAAHGRPAELEGKRVAVQGVGKVGRPLALRLLASGASVIACDTDDRAIDALRASCPDNAPLTIVDPDAIYDAEVDVLSPCALAGVLTRDTIDRLRATVVAGAANNQLGSADIDGLMVERRIAYAPDFAVNSGAVIVGALAHLDRRTNWRDTAQLAIERIESTITRIFEASRLTGEAPGAVALRLADEALVRPKTTADQWWPIG